MRDTVQVRISMACSGRTRCPVNYCRDGSPRCGATPHLETQRVTSCAADTTRFDRSKSSDCRCMTWGLDSFVAETVNNMSEVASVASPVDSTTQKPLPIEPSQARVFDLATAATTPEYRSGSTAGRSNGGLYTTGTQSNPHPDGGFTE